jgi:hypothetical protein
VHDLDMQAQVSTTGYKSFECISDKHPRDATKSNTDDSHIHSQCNSGAQCFELAS